MEIAKSKELNGYIEYNFKTGENVENAFIELATLIENRIFD
jgi:hypothetical protein